MFEFQFAQKTGEREVSSRKAAQRSVLGWYSALRGRMMNFLKKLF